MNAYGFFSSAILSLFCISGYFVDTLKIPYGNPKSLTFITGRCGRNRLLKALIIKATSDGDSSGSDGSNEKESEETKGDNRNGKDIPEELADLISQEYEISKNNNSTVDLSKYDWFNDEPFDSSDEEFANEYCESQIPDMETFYKNIDPYGMRYLAPGGGPSANKFLGRVYEVGKSIRDEDEESSNVYSIKELRSKFPNSKASDKTDTEKPKIEIKTSSPDNDHSKFLKDEVGEFNFGEEFDDADDESIVMEDELCRYFIRLPLIDWVDDEREAYHMAMSRLERSKNYSEQKQKYTTDFRLVFSSTPCSSVGIADSNCADAPETVNFKPKQLYIKEYKHNDLLNEIDKYESKPYPSIVDAIAQRDCKEPIFTMEENDLHENSKDPKDTEANSNSIDQMEDPLVYMGIPKYFIKPDEKGCKIINDSVFLKRKYDKTIGQVIEKIPIEEGYNTGIILLPNEPGFLDQNIRYLADELSIISKSFVFVPKLPGNNLMFTLALNRLTKLVQLVYKVDRLSFVALGNQGHKLIDYVYNAMGQMISDTNTPRDDKNDSDDINISRLRDLVSRQSVPILGDIMANFQYGAQRRSMLAARKARDVNVVKPLSRLLQAVALFDTSNINFKKIVDISLPFLILESNRNELFRNLLPLDDPKFSKNRKKYNGGNTLEGMDVFKFVKGELQESLQNMIDNGVRFMYLPNESNIDKGIDQYRITSHNEGVDTLVHVYRNASCHYYMKKPSADREELLAIGHAISFCAGWIKDWLY